MNHWNLPCFFRPRARFGAPTAGTRPRPTVAAATVKGIDINAEGEIDGVPTYDVDLDTLTDKPWLKPGKLIYPRCKLRSWCLV